MTPLAVTPAARGKKAKARSIDHKRAARPAAPARRVSGPAAGRGTGTTSRAPTRSPARSPAPARPARRTSGAARPAGRPATLSRALTARIGRFVRGLPDHPLLDQIVRGRAWIPLLGILLAGIVAMQVEVLKLSASMGRSLEQGTALQSRNEQLRASVAELGDDQRIERLAFGMGMVMPPPTAIKFLPERPAGQMARALAGVHPADTALFTANLPSMQAPGTAAAGSTGAAGSTSAAGATVATAVGTPVAPAAATGGSGSTTAPGVPASTPPPVSSPATGTSTVTPTTPPANAPVTTTLGAAPAAGGATVSGTGG